MNVCVDMCIYIYMCMAYSQDYGPLSVKDYILRHLI